DRWLALSPEERSLTAVFASGRETRGDINTRIQEGLTADGTLRGPGLDVTVHDRVSLTPEELRYTQFYKVGQQVTVTGHIPELGLRRGGTYEVTRVFTNKVEMRRGSEKIRFAPQKLDPTVTLERLQISTLDTVRLHEGETIRWTTNDTERGMDNAALATVTGIENGR
ncbi:AAA family ATPase, partial [Escherichia coli]|nr:AAA family ATPase [Escherichia coli]